MAQKEDKCPRCGEGRLRKWYELSAEEHEVVRRLPGTADYAFRERVTMHRWCNLCWHEETTQTPRNV
ncbi:MAG TPA: hypothetical protein VGC89_01215 [Pyrinomonadaceae bacterium]|jgi:hypothetical protein